MMLRNKLKMLLLGATLSGLQVAPALAGGEVFTYDSLGRLKSATFANGTTTNYSYDAAGNRLSSGAGTGSGGGLTPPGAAMFTMVSSSGTTTTFKNPNTFNVTPTASGQLVKGPMGYSGITSNTCNGSVAAGSTCVIVISAATPRCTSGAYQVQSFVTDDGGTVYGTAMPRPCSG